MTDSVQAAPVPWWQWCWQGRIDRARYIAWRSGVWLLFMAMFVGFSFLTGFLPVGWRPVMGLAIILSLLVTLVVQCLVAIRRAHDFNASAWLSLLSLIPLVNLLFWFVPGTAGANRHGEALPKSSRRVIVMAVLLPILASLLFLFLAVMGVVSYHLSIVERGATVDRTTSEPEP